ncbi:MAG: M57 family metalloprotease [Polyangiaceae bacterium]
MIASLVFGCAQAEDEENLDSTENVASTEGSRSVSFEDYMLEHVVPLEDGEGYMVEGDIHAPDLETVKRFWVASTAENDGLSVHRYASADDIWNRTERFNITYCIRPGDFGSDYSRIVDFMQRAASGWEAAANVRFVHLSNLDNSTDCVRTSSKVKYNVERNYSAGFTAGMGFPSFSKASRYLEMGDTSTWTDSFLLAVLTHEMGHALGFTHEHDSATGCDLTANDAAGYRKLTCYDGGSAMHYPDRAGWTGGTRKENIISQRDIEGAQSVYEAPTNVLNTASGTIYARQRSTGDIYQRSGSSWVKIGGPGQAFVTVGNTLYGQTPGGGRPVVYRGSSTGWQYIGGAAGQIFRCVNSLCATTPSGSDIARYNSSSNTWTVIGGPGARFQATTTQLFGVDPWTDQYTALWSGSGANWSIVGGGGSELIGGGTSMYRLTNLKNAIQRYDGGSTWTTIGGPGRQFVATTGNVYGLSPNRAAIYKYATTQWNYVHGAATRMFGSDGYLFATGTDNETIEQYNASANTWTSLGKP